MKKQIKQLSKTNQKKNFTKKSLIQRGSAAMVGIVCLSVFALVVIGVAFYLATLKEEPTLTYTPPAVTADDKLSDGKSNNELVQDARIINEGIKRDDTQRKAADTAIADQAQAIGDNNDTATTVESSRLSTLQTAFISESDRRLKTLGTTLQLLPRLTVPQQELTKKLITDESTAITGLKAKAASEGSFDAFSVDKTALDKEYGNYLLAIAQVNILVWANGQTGVEDKVNVLGGKYQERLNTAADHGQDTAAAQVLVNSLQANKTTAIGLTTAVTKAIAAVKPGDYNANRSVLRTYYTQLSTAHDKLDNVLQSAKSLTAEMAKLQN